MILEISRMITKYSGDEWIGNSNAERLVSLFSEHLTSLQTEFDDVSSGRRSLDTRDIFGPYERRDGVLGVPHRLELMRKLHNRFDDHDAVMQWSALVEVSVHVHKYF